MKWWKKPVLFTIGGTVYVGLEYLWRGRSHGSMFLAGGTCFLLLGQLGKAEPRLPAVLRIPVGAMVITMVELGFGLLFNRDYGVWDYRGQPGNLWGQICPAYMGLWLLLAPAAEWIYGRLDGFLSRRAG